MGSYFSKHKFLRELGPLVVALFLVGILFFSSIIIKAPKYSTDQLKAFAANPNLRTTFVGFSIKEQAYKDPNFLPLLGSSELEYFDAFHPSVYSTKYKTSYTPFLAGQPGTQSLSHFFYLSSVSEQLKNRKIVFIISPQWFTPKGVKPEMVNNFVSKGEVYAWLKTADGSDIDTQRFARRLLNIPNFTDDFLLKNTIETLADGGNLSSFNKFLVSAFEQSWKNEDLFFSYFANRRTERKSPLGEVYSNVAKLPEKSDFSKLEDLAYNLGEEAANNNDFGINNSVWTNSIQKVASQRKDVLKNVSYSKSPEYSDFQEVLNQFAKNHNDVQFVIQPVNGAWYSYSGLSLETLEKFSEKITYQLKSQGFNNILDLTDKYNEPYYVRDTIHFGTRGWLAMDKSISEFMKKPNTAKYQLNNQKFLSKEWQNEVIE